MRRFFQIVITSALVSAAAGGAWYLGYVTFRSGSDRPAVVVFSSPIDVEFQVDASDQRRGVFEPVVPGDRRRWRAGHGRGTPPQSLSVIISESTSNTPDCRPTFIHTAVTTVTFTYMPTVGIPNQFTATITADGLEFNFPANAVRRPGSEFHLSLPNASIRSVQIGGSSCNLGPRARVELRQR